MPTLPEPPVVARFRERLLLTAALALAACSSEGDSAVPTTTGAGGTAAANSSMSATSASMTSTSTATSTSTSTNSSSSSSSATSTVTSGALDNTSSSSSSSSSGSGGGTQTSSSGGGMGGMGGTGTTTTGGKAAPDPSDGCGNTNPMTGSANGPLKVAGHDYYVKLPSDYDPNTPYLALFMFNPTGNPINWAEQNAGFERNGAADGAIRIYPHPANSGSGWGAGDVMLFEPLYESITANFCVDKARVFAAGESSGGDFSSILGCEFGDKLRGVAPCATKPVSAYPLNVSQRNCVGKVTSVVIHGVRDTEVGPQNGPLTRDFYVELNNCGSMSEPVEGYTDSMSNCVEYQGCDEGYPVFWCQHSDPEYNNTNHGWPHFAADMLWELFSSY